MVPVLVKMERVLEIDSFKTRSIVFYSEGQIVSIGTLIICLDEESGDNTGGKIFNH